MVDDAQESILDSLEQRLVSNGLLQVTVTVLVTAKWHVDNESPYHERMFFLDGVSLDGIGTPFYVRAWWEIPLDDLSLFEELNKVPMNSFLMVSSRYSTLESTGDFHLEGEEGQEQVEGGSTFCLGMKAPTLKEVYLQEIGPSLADSISVFAP